MYLGIDIGSVSSNAVLIDRNKNIMGFSIMQSGYDHKTTIENLINEICKNSSIDKSSIIKIVGTGYGRENIPGCYKTVTEITCHAVGVRRLFPEAQMVIDIGGQDSKVIRLTDDGYVDSFDMNDKCSAGTGRFLEVMAGVMKMDLKEFSEFGMKSRNPYKISSICTVFAESEVISGISRGIAREDIIAGLYQSIVRRIISLIGNITHNEDIILTGGVAKNMGIYEYLKKEIPCLRIPVEPQITGALGAALIAAGDG